MREFARVVEDPSFVRDLSTGAVLSDDRAAFERRKERKQAKTEQNKLMMIIEDLQSRVMALEERLASNGC